MACMFDWLWFTNLEVGVVKYASVVHGFPGDPGETLLLLYHCYTLSYILDLIYMHIMNV